MNDTTLEIKECLQTLQIDEKLIDHFIELLMIVRAKAMNGQRASVARLRELLVEAVKIDPCSQEAYGILHETLDAQICKTRESLKKFK